MVRAAAPGAPSPAHCRHSAQRSSARHPRANYDSACRLAALHSSDPLRGTDSDSRGAPRQLRVFPISVAVIAFFIREDTDGMTPRNPGAELAELIGLSHGAQMVLDFLRLRGASFFAEIV